MVATLGLQDAAAQLQGANTNSRTTLSEMCHGTGGRRHRGSDLANLPARALDMVQCPMSGPARLASAARASADDSSIGTWCSAQFQQHLARMVS
jgi:hypothetical protein